MERWDTVQTPDGEMRCFVAAPDGASARPAVVVIQHAGGVDAFVQEMTRRFGAAGFAAVSPDLYHREDPANSDDPLTRMSRLRDRNIIADVDAAFAHLRTLPEADAGRTGITGFCMGGRVAYLIATQRDDVRAAVVFYGGNTMVPWGEGRAPFEMSERIASPVLGLFGADDQNPSPADVEKIDAELTRLGKPHEFHSYPGAGHGFMAEGRPNYRAEAAADAWDRCVAWFRDHLGA
jgi:carboxymethylenebutenolidase